MTEEQFDCALKNVHDFIEDCGVEARVIVELGPKSGSMRKSYGESFSKGWDTGFYRCLAEFKRIAEMEREND